ncbi:hypothetical protein BCY86_05170 [Pajaroellobacter abortibovis]|uniref:PEGA domain-containing protein n=2 Tax=Pajaroellobacter abortibovis TaxID=1882918 RepID=A0A1L6MXF5_9BACT|nr:hypothetical protein BCY86_05170 [Pajaroellobacter abortibovis]
MSESTASESPSQALKDLFSQAQRAEDRGEWEIALERFTLITSLRESASARYHMGWCRENLKQPLAALVDYEAAKVLAAQLFNREKRNIRRQDTLMQVIRLSHEGIKRLQQYGAFLRLRVSQRVDSIKLDHQLMMWGSETNEWGMWLAPGMHLLEVDAERYVPYETSVYLAKGEVHDHLVSLVPMAHVKLVLPPAFHAQQIAIKLDEKELDHRAILHEGVWILPGTRWLSVSSPGYPPFSKKIDFKEGERLIYEVPWVAKALEPIPSPADTSESSVVLKKSNKMAIGLTVGAATLATGGTITYLLMSSEAKEMRYSCLQHRFCDKERTYLRVLNVISILAWTGALGVGTLAAIEWIYPLSSDLQPSLPAVPSSKTRVGTTLQVQLGLGHVDIGGTFY